MEIIDEACPLDSGRRSDARRSISAWRMSSAGVEALAVRRSDGPCAYRPHGDPRGCRVQDNERIATTMPKVQRPRVRDHAGKEVSLELAGATQTCNLLLEWALNLGPERVGPQVPPRGPSARGRPGESAWRRHLKSAVSRRFVALSRKKMKAWLASDLSLDPAGIQIDGLHVGDHEPWWRRSASMATATSMPGRSRGHGEHGRRPGLADNLLAAGARSDAARLLIVDGAKALSKAIRNTFGVAAAIQRCQVHKGRNIIERLPQHLHASVKKALPGL